MSHIDLRLHIDNNEGYLEIKGIERVDSSTDLTPNAILGLQETLFQTDWGQIDFPNGIFEALDGTDVIF